MTTSGLRAWGQKDLSNGNAHLWVQNPAHTWYNVVRGNTVAALTGEVTVRGFRPNAPHRVEWWDTDEDDSESQVRTTEEIFTDERGALTLRIVDLTTDVAVRISSPAETLPR